MTLRIPADLSPLSHEQKDALIGALLAEIEAQKVANAALSARITELEAKLQQPPKTPGQLQHAALARAKAEPAYQGQARGATSGQPGAPRRRAQAGG
jgi:transposase